MGLHGIFVLSYIIVFSTMDMCYFCTRAKILKIRLPNFLPLGILIVLRKYSADFCVCLNLEKKFILFKTRLPMFRSLPANVTVERTVRCLPSWLCSFVSLHWSNSLLPMGVPWSWLPYLHPAHIFLLCGF